MRRLCARRSVSVALMKNSVTVRVAQTRRTFAVFAGPRRTAQEERESIEDAASSRGLAVSSATSGLSIFAPPRRRTTFDNDETVRYTVVRLLFMSYRTPVAFRLCTFLIIISKNTTTSGRPHKALWLTRRESPSIVRLADHRGRRD